jgi:Spy/CpxP family protein refolding chaperone
MKNIRLFTAVAAFAVMALTSSLNAQPTKKENWHEKMMAEKIAFITMELDLTPEEAQVFWPVYNQVRDERMRYQKAVHEAYGALQKALEGETVSDKDVDKLLDEYLAAKQAQAENTKGGLEKFRKVLSGKKVAKLYIAEENFRRHKIRDMKLPHGHAKR